MLPYGRIIRLGRYLQRGFAITTARLTFAAVHIGSLVVFFTICIINVHAVLWIACTIRKIIIANATSPPCTPPRSFAMSSKGISTCKFSTAFWTEMWLFPSVKLHVPFQIMKTTKLSMALLA